jgi:hypothetical protein
MLELLCLSDLHLGETYSYLDGSRWDWDDSNQAALEPFYRGVALLDGLQRGDEPRVRVRDLVLLGDIFELGTATIDQASRSGAKFFEWLFLWLLPDRVIYVPGNHDHVFWMWWCAPPPEGGPPWWESEPGAVEQALSEAYADCGTKASHPDRPEAAEGKPWREALLTRFFGSLLDPSRFRLAYPVYTGPHCGPPGFRGRPFRSLYTHGHMNDPMFVNPGGLVDRVMHGLSPNPEEADLATLERAEETTWRFTHRWWYPAEKGSSLKEWLYLCSIPFEKGHACVHRGTSPGRYTREPAPELGEPDRDALDFHNLIRAAAPGEAFLEPTIYVYGHTHNGGAMPVEPSLLLYNTGGWLSNVTDDPKHTHLFGIDAGGTAKMVRVTY